MILFLQHAIFLPGVELEKIVNVGMMSEIKQISRQKIANSEI
jgi:hypothetical protein